MSGRRRLSLQIQPLINTSKDSSLERPCAKTSLNTIPWSMGQLSKNDIKYKSESCCLNYSNVGECDCPGKRLKSQMSCDSGNRASVEAFVWVWSNVATRDKMRRKSLAAFLTPTANEPWWVNQSHLKKQYNVIHTKLKNELSMF